MIKFRVAITICLLFIVHITSAQAVIVGSPDNHIQVIVHAGAKMGYSIRFNGRPVLGDSPLGFEFNTAPPLEKNLLLLGTQKSNVNSNWTPVIKGRHAVVHDYYNQARLSLQESSYPRRRLDLIFRVFNDGVAFRYFLPQRPGQTGNEITRELTGFQFVGADSAWIADYGSYRTSQEKEFFPGQLASIKETSIVGLPLLTKVNSQCYAAISEANITDWAGFYLGGSQQNGGTLLHTKLAPLPGEAEGGVKVKLHGDRLSPWRVVMLANQPGKLIESEMIENLNDSCRLEDVSWIHPGKCAWDHWWSGDVKMDTKTLESYIQSAADLGFPYMLIDWQWYGPFNKPDADITHVNPAVDMPEVLRFAKERNVRCWLWLYNTDADRQFQQAFALYESWGIAGIKIDFMDSDDQEMVNWYHKIVESAAAHHLMVNFHGAYKPDGYQRTYPNLMTREGVMGNEYSKWSMRITPEHNVTLPFTRMLAGPMDYTPGGFLNRSPESFRNGVPTNVMSTRCQQLAMFVIYESPITTVCDAPENYQNQPGTEFLRVVPTTWDDSRFLAGYPGQYICMARRSGNTWFLAAMNNGTARTFNLPLNFLESGSFELTSFEDADDAATNAEHLVKRTRAVRSESTIRIRLAPGGGYAAHLTRK